MEEMKHYEFKVAGVYYTSDDYSMFKKMERNRAVTKARKENLIKSFSKKDIDNPIIVNEKLEIAEGQGRYEARKALGLPILFIVQEGIGIEECMLMNQYTKAWTTTDFISSYAEEGNENYIRLKNICAETKLATGLALDIVGGGYSEGKKGRTELITAGELVFTHEDVIELRDIISHANDILFALQRTTKPNKEFYLALKVVMKTAGYSRKRMISQCKKHRGTYAQMSGIEDELKEFSRMYNDKLSPAKKIYFEDYMRNKGRNVRKYETGSKFTTVEDDVSTLSM